MKSGILVCMCSRFSLPSLFPPDFLVLKGSEKANTRDQQQLNSLKHRLRFHWEYWTCETKPVFEQHLGWCVLWIHFILIPTDDNTVEFSIIINTVLMWSWIGGMWWSSECLFLSSRWTANQLAGGQSEHAGRRPPIGQAASQWAEAPSQPQQQQQQQQHRRDQNTSNRYVSSFNTSYCIINLFADDTVLYVCLRLQNAGCCT